MAGAASLPCFAAFFALVSDGTDGLSKGVANILGPRLTPVLNDQFALILAASACVILLSAAVYLLADIAGSLKKRRTLL